MVPQAYYRCWVEVDLDALRQNVQAIRRRIGPQTRLLAVVKADAYGHGLAPIARVLMELGVHGFAVANLAEALTLRHIGGAGWPILLFGSALPFEVAAIIEHRLTPTISTLDEARWFSAAAAERGRTVEVQVEVDTGMGRVGFWHEEAVAAIRAISRLPQLTVGGVYTHFPSADANLAETRQELRIFERITAELRQVGCEIPLRHAANSAALLTLPEAALDLARPGLLLYGISPIGAANRPEFQPVLSFKARVAFVKQVAAGRTISYGQTFVAPSPMTIATIATGYGDGFSRQLSNHAHVLINGRRCPVVGNVTMDQIMVNVTSALPVQSGDEAVLIGRQGREELGAREMAQQAGTIAWEVLCGIAKSSRVPRIYRGAQSA